MANPRASEKTKAARGTTRPDRKPPEAPKPPDAADRLPMRPQRVDGQGKVFWNRHFRRLWDAGWVTKSNMDSFAAVCVLYDGMLKLEAIWKEEGQTQTTHTQFGSKEISHPAWTEYKSTVSQFLTWLDHMGLTPDGEVKKLPDLRKEKEEREEKPKAPSIMAFKKGKRK